METCLYQNNFLELQIRELAKAIIIHERNGLSSTGVSYELLREYNSSSLGYRLKKYCSSLVASLQEGLTYVKASFIGQVLIKTSPLIFILNRMYLISFLISVSYHFYMPSLCLKTGKEDKGQKWGGSNDGGAWNSKDAGRGCWRCRSHQNQTQYVVVVIIFSTKNVRFYFSTFVCVCVCL